MKISIMVLFSLLLTVSLIANSHLTDFRYAKINSITEELDPLSFESSSSNEVYPYLPDINLNNESPSTYAPEWATDRLVSDQWNMSQSVISFDYDADGYLYLMGLSKNSDHDTLFLYKSTDQGMNWNQVWMYGISTPWEIWDVEMRVNHVGSNPDIYFAFIDSNYSTAKRHIYFGQLDQPGMSVDWTLFDPDTNDLFTNPMELSLDISNGASPSIWCTYSHETVTNSGWSTVYSNDGGSSWDVMNHTTSRGGRDPYISIGEDYAYIICIYTASNDSNGIRMYRRPLTTTGSFFWVSSQNLATRSYPCVASTRETSPNNRVVVLYQEGTGSTRRIRESISSDGGQNFTVGQLWSPAGDVEVMRPYVRSGWDGGVNDEMCGVATKVGSFDSLICAYNTSGSWGSRTIVNDHDATGEVTPQGTVIITGRAIIYRQWGSSSVWFDAYANTAVEEIVGGVMQNWSVSTLNNQISINFALTSPQQVSIKLYDLTGRNVLSQNLGILNEGNHSCNLSADQLTSGRYFVNFYAGDQQLSKTVVLF